MSALHVVVRGTPVSAQTKTSKRLEQWRQHVATCARAAIAEDERLEWVEVQVSIVWFCFEWEEGDVDNITKPILDGLSGPAYFDDQWVTQLVVRRTELSRGPVELIDAPPALVTSMKYALEHREDFVFVRVEPGVDHRRLPWAT